MDAGQESLLTAFFPQMSPDERQVWGCLQNHVGHENAITWEDICLATGLDNRKARQAKENLINVYRKRVGSTPVSPYGVFLIQDAAELEDVCKRYRGQALSLMRTEANLRRIGMEELLGQLALEARL